MKNTDRFEKAEHRSFIALYPLTALFSRLGKVRRHPDGAKGIITAGILSVAMIIAVLSVMSMSAFAAGSTPLTFAAEADGSSVTFNYLSGSDVMYKLNGGDWTAYTKGTPVSLNKNETVSFRGTGVKTDYDNHFSVTGKIAASGDVTSLTNRIGGDAALSDSCYLGMFFGCEDLVAAPELPSTTLANACYLSMFRGCVSLKAAPRLPATTLAEYSCNSIFYGCTSLKTAPALPATVLADGCYAYMFYGCKSLEAAPALPATELADGCYYSMFYGCTSLKVSTVKTGNYTKEWRIPAEGAVEKSATEWNIDMLSGTGGTFKGDPATDTVYYIYEYLPLTFTAEADDSSVTFNYSSGSDVMYKQDGGDWTAYTKGTPVSLNKNETVSFRGTGVKTDYNHHFSVTGRIAASGDVTSLTNGVGGDVALPASCYDSMFTDCTGLTAAPDLPSAVLASRCYRYMFAYCKDLTAAPRLSATSLGNYCYQGMFTGCEGLTAAPELPATVLTDGCYQAMFADCKGLSAAPRLPATTLTENCYMSMFIGCKGLSTAPELPATALANGCYDTMFANCTSLETVPELPATTLTGNCYFSMFYNCTSLRVSTEKTGNYTIEWRIPSEKAATSTAFNWNTNMLFGTGGTFKGNPATDTVYYIFEYRPLVFKAEADGSSVTFNYLSGSDVMYRLGNGAWTAYTKGTTVLLDKNETVSFRGTDVITNRGNHFSMTGRITASGDVTALTNGVGGDVALSDSCYLGMFAACKALEAAPALPSTVLAEHCYTSIFEGCTGLKTAPALPATNLTRSCYSYMFKSCTSLEAAPVLPATTMQIYCYSNMFDGCVSLTAAPRLPATALAEDCYNTMFKDCKSLKTAPALPANELDLDCYSSMFEGCESLTVPPDLPATALSDNCYYSMFRGCTALKVSAEKTGDYTREWRIPSEGAIAMPAYIWNTDMLSGTGGTFTGEPNSGKTYYIYVDHTPPVISGIADGKTYCEKAEFTVTDDGATDKVKVNGKELTASDGKYSLTDSGSNTVIVTDKTGNGVVITVTFNPRHTYDNACDTTCNECNETRTVTHSYRQDWSFDGTEHWHECSVCGDKTDIDAHTPEDDDDDCTTEVHCSVCHAVAIESRRHDFTEKITDAAHLKSAATYTSPAVYYYNCSHCSSIDLTHTYESGTKLIDTTAPTGEIKTDTNSFKAFINSITFGLFFKESQTVTVTGEDDGIGMDKIYYLKSDTALELAAVEALTADSWTEGNTFTVSPDWKGVVYAKLTDKSGNALYISSDGLVYDATSPVIAGVTDGGEYCITAAVVITEENPGSVKLNGVDVTLTEGGFSVPAKDGTQQITVTDKAGNVASATVTVHAGHTRDNGEITLLPTVTAKGVKTYTCTVCGATETEEIPKLAPSITEGGNGTYQKGSNGSLTFRSDAAFADFESVSVDGEVIDSDCYTAAEGSTVITLTADYLDTLSVGRHTLSVISESGTASTEFTVTAGSDNPPTGDTTLWIALVLVPVALTATLCIATKRRSANSK